MKRRLRILLNAATLFSLLLFIATSILWIRSYQTRDNWGDGKTEWTLSKGRLIAITLWRLPDRLSTGTRTNNVAPLPERLHGWDLPGVSYKEHWLAIDPSRPTVTDFLWQHSITLRLWLIAAITGVLPLAWLVRAVRRRKKIAPGSCQYCGYDLRATPERCPECGKQQA